MVKSEFRGCPYSNTATVAGDEQPLICQQIEDHKISIRDFDGNPDALTELDALIAYLQMLGTLVDLEAYKQDENLR